MAAYEVAQKRRSARRPGRSARQWQLCEDSKHGAGREAKPVRGVKLSTVSTLHDAFRAGLSGGIHGGHGRRFRGKRRNAAGSNVRTQRERVARA